MISYPDAIHNAWLPLCAESELGTKPLRRLLHGVPLAIFRAKNGIAVLRDRCPHRNVPLSNGCIENGAIVCPYHGWAFEGDGTCSRLPGAEPSASLAAEAMPVKTTNGMVFTNTGTQPRDFVTLPFPLNDPSYDHHVWPTRYQGSLIDGMENLLDPAHPHLMHPRIVGRSHRRVEVRVERRQTPDSVECTYHEGERTRGWLPALLEGQRLKGVGRFFAPTTCQLSFIGKSGPKLFITAIFSPQTKDNIQAIATFSTPKGILPAWLKAYALVYFHTQIIRQDQAGVVGGAGWLAQTIIKAILAKNVVAEKRLGMSYRSRMPENLSLGLATTDSQVLVDASDTIMLSVRPADFKKLKINATGKLVISVMAGVPVETIASETRADRIVRALPNVAASVGYSYTPIFASKAVTDEERLRVTRIFEACGICDEVKSEEHLDYLTGLTGSGPAYPALLAEALGADAVRRGIAPDIAQRAVSQLLIGSGRLMERETKPMSGIVKEFVDYGGVIAAAIKAMRGTGFDVSIESGLAAAVEKVNELR